MRCLICLACLLAGFGGCAAKSPQREFCRALQEIASWSSSSRVTVDAWRHRSVPTSYAVDALREAQQDVRQEVIQLNGLRPIGARQRDAARAAGERIIALCEGLEQAVRQSNGADAFRLAGELRDVERRLAHLLSSVPAA